MACKIINNSGLEISGFEDMIQSLVDFSQNRFGFKEPPSIFLNSDSDNAANPLGKTAYYDPQQVEIHVYTDGRHPKDIMRSISHELIHHKQNGEGNLQGNHYSGEGYAQKDPHMRKMEKEAVVKGPSTSTSGVSLSLTESTTLSCTWPIAPLKMWWRITSQNHHKENNSRK